MSPPSILSDDLLRQLMAVGQVDIMVGVPTLNNAATVGAVVQAAHFAFGNHFARERTVLINSDGGSSDGTPDIVREASRVESETVLAAHSLRTRHRISAPYHGVPGKGTALRTLFAAADLLQARAVAILDPEITSITPDGVFALLGPVLRDGVDFVSPAYARHPLDGPLVSQLVRPLFRAAYGRRLHEPMAADLGCSGTFAASCLEEAVWESDFARYGIDLWLSCAAVAGGFRMAEAALGPRTLGPRVARPGLQELFPQVVGSLFSCLEMHEAFWAGRTGSEAVPLLGEAPAVAGPAPPVERASLIEAFRTGVTDLGPLLEQVLSPETLEALHALSRAEGVITYPDRLWVATVMEFAAAHYRGVMHRQHLLQALVPLYLGRLAAFHARAEEVGVDATERALEALGESFEEAKPHLLGLWNKEGGR
ncbi:MAG: glycosyl transferase family 2 [Acidobacteria bacterium]|jgi:hypothetical protein|nr:glycosyl transferase family 2 [Acidobacteriota bacterium]